VQGAVVLAVASPFVDFEWQHGVLKGFVVAIAAIVLLNLMLTGIAQAMASRIQTMQGFHLLMNLALFPLLFFSGAFFPLDGLPRWLELLALVNPITYAVDALELAAYASSDATFIGLGIDFAVLGVLAAAIYALSLSRTPKLTYSGS
jgi:ABC-2 type transport system permease protein